MLRNGLASSARLSQSMPAAGKPSLRQAKIIFSSQPQILPKGSKKITPVSRQYGNGAAFYIQKTADTVCLEVAGIIKTAGIALPARQPDLPPQLQRQAVNRRKPGRRIIQANH